MEKTRTLVLMATMRSPTIGSPDQTHLRAQLRREAPISAGDRTPIFPHARASPKGTRKLKKIGPTNYRTSSPGWSDVPKLLVVVIVADKTGRFRLPPMVACTWR